MCTHHQTSTGDTEKQTEQEAPQAPPPRIALTNGGAAERLSFSFRQRFTKTSVCSQEKAQRGQEPHLWGQIRNRPSRDGSENAPLGTDEGQSWGTITQTSSTELNWSQRRMGLEEAVLCDIDSDRGIRAAWKTLEHLSRYHPAQGG